jgi:hypothetical protein
MGYFNNFDNVFFLILKIEKTYKYATSASSWGQAIADICANTDKMEVKANIGEKPRIGVFLEKTADLLTLTRSWL